MTYNFDPDRWYDNELAALHAAREAGEITDENFQKAVEELDRKYESMWSRLDGSYQIPKRG